jgi:co-chaperonin GroES (HSP10)
MAKTLLVPDHILQKRNKEKAYVKKEERVLDPTLLDKSFKERLPQPTGWRILVAPYQGKEVTDKGVIIPDQIRQREALATVVAYVLKVGPLAYKDEGKFGNQGNPWCKEGDWICIGRYAGSRFSLEDMEVRVINDDEVIATLLDPEDIKHI